MKRRSKYSLVDRAQEIADAMKAGKFSDRTTRLPHGWLGGRPLIKKVA